MVKKKDVLELFITAQVTVFKSLTNLIILTGDYFWHGQKASALVMTSLAVMTVGAMLASWNDIEFS